MCLVVVFSEARCVRFAPSGKRLVLLDETGFRVFDITKLKAEVISTLSLAGSIITGPLSSVRFSTDGQSVVAIGSHQSMIQMWSVTSPAAVLIGAHFTVGVIDVVPSATDESQLFVLHKFPNVPPAVTLTIFA